ncbi:Glycine cleavage system H protein [Meloidogyne graminicola]|uniref:Glycine cleavage system H protein n=1 Tax=Meloidogyne graminicola TaxID=189291 RepID=A0A8S9ZZ98_9BILA|nr:Glycine cleavage system H protein [Meloidogyne graminicola]
MFHFIRPNVILNIRSAINLNNCLQQISGSNGIFLRHLSFTRKIEERFYTKKHEWIELNKPIKDEIGTVGITDFAQV